MKVVISVVIVAGLKREKELIRCLNSIYLSSFKSFEVILVDNSCSNLSVDIKKIFPHTRIIQMPENTGVFAYNVGFVNAVGEFVLALDDDSSIETLTLEKIVNKFKKKEKNVGILTLNQYNPIGKYYYYQHYCDLGIKEVNQFVGGASVFRKEIFLKIGYYDPDFFCWAHEDDFAIRAYVKGYKIHFEKEIVINHFEKETSVIRRDKVFYTFRNKAWVNIKHFSYHLFPLLFLKDCIWFLTFSPFKKRSSFQVLLFFIFGTLCGYFLPIKALSKRKVMPRETEKRYAHYYLLIGKHVLKKLFFTN